MTTLLGLQRTPPALAILALVSQAAAAGSTPPFVTELTLLLVASAVAAYVVFRLGITPIIGFLAAGVLINALGLVNDPELVEASAEIGVILLLFTIGIEFSLERLGSIRRLIFLGGGVQVALVVGLVALGVMLFGGDWRSAVFSGFLIALSSTAIVMKLLADRADTQSEVGRISLGILIFQDLAVVLMVLLVPILAGDGGTGGDLLLALAKAGGIIAVVLLLARRGMPWLLEVVARTCSQEIFLLSVIGICFGTAWLTSLAGVSLSLGAFLAGLLVSESRFGQQAFSEILPLQILFSAAFFLSVGLLLDVGFLLANLPLVLLGLLVFVLIKTLAATVAVRALGYPLASALPAALLLAQVGEFSFVLERSGREVGLSPFGLGEAGAQTFIACTVLLMAATPLLARLGDGVGARLARREAEGATPESAAELEGWDDLDDHVVIAGYGAEARQLAAVLETAGLPYGIVTLSPAGASEAQERQRRVILGDYTRQPILALLGLDRARLLVIPDDRPETAERAVVVVRSLAPDLPIVAATPFSAALDELMGAGASTVVAKDRAASERLVAAMLSTLDFAQTEIEGYLSALGNGLADAGGGGRTLALDEEQRRSSHCSHAELTTVVRAPDALVCPACVEAGDAWVHLRICMSCGYVGCCDSSKNRHARRHADASAHPVVRSLEAGETWAWCYPDETFL